MTVTVTVMVTVTVNLIYLAKDMCCTKSDGFTMTRLPKPNHESVDS